MDDLIENAPCGFVSFDDSGEILATNARLPEILGYGRRELDGRLIGDILTVGAKIFYQTHFFPLLKLHGKADEIYLDLKSKNGHNIPVLTNAVRHRRGGTTVNDCVFVLVQQRSQYENEILVAKKAAEQATRDKTRAFEDLNAAHARTEQQATELAVQSAELEKQQDELMRLNGALQTDVAARTRIEEHLRELIAREALVNNIGRAVRESTSIEVIQQTAVAGLGSALQTDRCFITQYDMAHNRAWIALDWRQPGMAPLAGEFRISDLDFNVEALYSQDAPLVVNDIETDVSPNVARAMASVGLRSAVGVALFAYERLVAVLTAGMVDSVRDWTIQDIALVQAVATQARSAMEAERARQRERKIAQRLQEALLPSSPGRIPGVAIDTYYRPALDEAEIGGDFFDVFDIGNLCYAIVVADVSGKGLEAAAQIASVRHMLRAMLYQGSTTLAESITQLNNMLAAHNLLSGFATLFVGVYDNKNRNLQYVSCGHEPGLVRRAPAGEVIRLNTTGPVLGAFGGVRYTQGSIELAPGDAFALFTDGLTEAGLERSNMLEIDGIEEIFAAATAEPRATPSEIAMRMMAAIIDRVTPAGLRDDVCLLVACVE